MPIGTLYQLASSLQILAMGLTAMLHWSQRAKPTLHAFMHERCTQYGRVNCGLCRRSWPFGRGCRCRRLPRARHIVQGFPLEQGSLESGVTALTWVGCVLGTLIMMIVQTGTLIRSVQLLALANAPVAGKSLKASTKLRPPMSARPGTDSPLP